ncbi:related to enoyl-CoA hydratase/isomerase [Phialocephala subalpina]|uniref:Related to enoyl-CoA hydratase/isomerase n=1 Tax=Phialocephala subalpina TaxID=576137 RepID=A0A1L7WGN8_9HELO|nr:related to enoyl-CoA hydratase/isomerase [Phialocephala subalpina]
MASKPLFTLQIPNSPGTFVCTSLSDKVYLLTFTSPPDNRLLTPFLQTFLLALDILEFSYPHGVVVTTSGIPKFYSNGLDLEHSSSTPNFFPNSLFALFKRLLTYPMPTVALVNGHAFAGGFMVAMYHDYRIFNPSRGFVCLNELDLGVPLKPAMSSIFRQKLSPQIYKTMVLEAKRFSAKEALEGGIVDASGGMEELKNFIGQRKLSEKSKMGVYGLLKAEMFRETLGYLDMEGHEREEERYNAYLEKEDKRKEEEQKKVAEWEKSASKAKL